MRFYSGWIRILHLYSTPSGIFPSNFQLYRDNAIWITASSITIMNLKTYTQSVRQPMRSLKQTQQHKGSTKSKIFDSLSFNIQQEQHSFTVISKLIIWLFTGFGNLSSVIRNTRAVSLRAKHFFNSITDKHKWQASVLVELK